MGSRKEGRGECQANNQSIRQWHSLQLHHEEASYQQHHLWCFFVYERWYLEMQRQLDASFVRSICQIGGKHENMEYAGQCWYFVTVLIVGYQSIIFCHARWDEGITIKTVFMTTLFELFISIRWLTRPRYHGIPLWTPSSGAGDTTSC